MNEGGECIHGLRSCQKVLRETEWEVKLIHVYREENRAADWLANQGVALTSGLVYLDSIPSSFCVILEEDARGMALPRLAPP